MADFVAVLRKTIGALGENTPEMREKVYEKARSTIEAKLAAISPPPPASVVDRQRKALEDAIAVVRAEYARDSEAEPDEELEDVFASLRTMGNVVPQAKPAAAPATSAAPAATAPSRRPEKDGNTPLVAPAATAPRPSSAALDPAADIPAPSSNDGKAGVAGDLSSGAREAPRETRGTSGLPKIIAALVLLLVLAGGSYAVWINRDDFASMAGFGSTPATPPEPVVTTAEELVEEEPAPEAAALPAEEPAEDPAPEADADNEPDVAAAPPVEDEADSGEVDKFTQRLLPDGTEVDAGRAGGDRTIGEGTSVAAVVPPAGTPPADNAPETETAQAAEGAEAAGETEATQQSVAIAQRAIFYEERTTSAQGSAEMGTIVWSLVQESPGGDLPSEPAIRAEANIPGKDVQLRMTIRRNGDQSLPASHIVEMIFLTPEGFEGGGISSVSRISFKETEQAAGNPLIGIPAKIADGFFLIALGNAPAEIEANTTLLRRQSWVDIPIVYQSGRRALLSLEKGIPGDRVFEQALQAWAEASSG